MRLIILPLLLVTVVALAQDTIRIELKESEQRFLKENLLLLAQRYQVDANKALIQQAKLWPNPQGYAELSAYTPSTGYFDIGKNGQKAFSIQQLIVTAGKRHKNVQMATEQAKLTELEFFDLLRTLRFELRQNFYTLHYTLLTYQRYSQQLLLIEGLLRSFEIQYQKGNLPMKEVVRLKTLYFQLNNDRTELFNEIAEREKELKTLLHSPSIVLPVVDEAKLSAYQSGQWQLLNLADSALNNRTDFKIAQSQTKLALLNYSLQRREAVPDIQIGAMHDQASAYVPNYNAITFSIPLPLWNRNQGNIRSAKHSLEVARTQEEQRMMEITNEVLATRAKLEQVEKEYQRATETLGPDIEVLNKSVNENFQKRNLSLLEFVDFFESYNENILQFNRLKMSRLSTYEELNFVTGSELFKP